MAENQMLQPLFCFELPLTVNYYHTLPEDQNDLFYRKFQAGYFLDETTGHLVQNLSETDHSLIQSLYQSGSTGYNITGSHDNLPGNHAIRRQQEFLTMILNSLGGVDIKGKKVLEIGCSTGQLLNEFKKLGAVVLGCDPGPWQAFARKMFGIEVLCDYFDSCNFGDELFDLIVSTAFLDQTEDPGMNLVKMRSLLKPGGAVVSIVRDFSTHLRLGNPFGFSIEHTAYFTPESLKNLFFKAGLKPVATSTAAYGFGVLVAGKATSMDIPAPSLSEELLTAISTFHQKSTRLIHLLQERIDQFRGNSIGILGVGIESANLFSLLEFKDIPLTFYEKDQTYAGTYYSSIPFRISDESLLQQDSHDELWIVPLAFADQIERKLLELHGLGCSIVNLKRFCEYSASLDENHDS